MTGEGRRRDRLSTSSAALALVADSAVGSVSVRSARPATCALDGWLAGSLGVLTCAVIGSILDDSGVTVLVAAAAVLFPLALAAALRAEAPPVHTTSDTPPGYAPRT